MAEPEHALSIEQLSPFPSTGLSEQLDCLPEARDPLWIREEPANMGALSFVEPRIKQLARGRHLRTIKRSPLASPATASSKAHELEQTTLVNLSYN
jgi:2-oxoglutarate dehydrogenase E1 component